MANKVSVKINGATMAYPSGTLTSEVLRAVKTALRGALGDEYDITVNVNATKILPVVRFYPGDVYQYRYGGIGTPYVFIRQSDRWGNQQWSGNGEMTDTKMREGVNNGWANKCVVSPV